MPDDWSLPDDPATADAFSRLTGDSSSTSLLEAGYQPGGAQQFAKPSDPVPLPSVDDVIKSQQYQPGDLTQPDTNDLDKVNAALHQQFMDPSFIGQHPELPDPSGASSREFSGDESIAGYAKKARKAYEEAMFRHGARAGDVKVWGDAFEQKVKRQAIAVALGSLVSSQPRYESEWEKQPFFGDIIARNHQRHVEQAWSAISAGKGDMNDYLQVASDLSDQSYQQNQPGWRKGVLGALGVLKPASEFGQLSGVAKLLAPGAEASGVAKALGGGAAFTAVQFPLTGAQDLLAGKPLGEVARGEFNQLATNSIFAGMGLFGPKDAPPGMVKKGLDYAWDTIKMIAAGEAGKEFEHGMSTSDEGSALLRLARPDQTNQERADNFREWFYKEGGPLAVLNVVMRAMHSGESVTPKKMSDQLLSEGLAKVKAQEVQPGAVEGIYKDLFGHEINHEAAKEAGTQEAPKTTPDASAGKNGEPPAEEGEGTAGVKPHEPGPKVPPGTQEPPSQVWQHTGTKFRNVEGGAEFTAKDGRIYRVRGETGAGALSGQPYAKVTLHDAKGQEIGGVKFDKSEDPTGKTITGTDLRMRDDYQGKGKVDLRRQLVNGMYDFMHEEGAEQGHSMTGTLVPSKDLSPGGKAVWERNAALAEAKSSPEARQKYRADQIRKTHNDTVLDKNIFRSQAWRALKEHGVEARNYNRNYEDASKVPGLDEVAGKLADDRPDLLRKAGQEPSDILHDMLRNGMEKPMTHAEAMQEAEAQLAGEFSPEERNGVKTALQRAGLPAAKAEEHARRLETEADREAARREGKAQGDAAEPAPGEHAPGSALHEVAPGVAFKREPGAAAPGITERVRKSLHGFLGDEAGSVDLSLWDNLGKEEDKSESDLVKRMRGKQPTVPGGQPLGRQVVHSEDYPGPAEQRWTQGGKAGLAPGERIAGQATREAVVGKLEEAGKQAKALKERLARSEKETPPGQSAPQQPLSETDWRQNVTRLHANAYLREMGNALREPSAENLQKAGAVLDRLQKMAQSRGLDASAMIQKELPEFAALIEKNHAILDHWSKHPEDLPHSPEVTHAITAAGAAAQHLALDPASVRSAIAGRLQSAHEATRLSAQTQGPARSSAPEAAQEPTEAASRGAVGGAGTASAAAGGSAPGGDKLSFVDAVHQAGREAPAEDRLFRQGSNPKVYISRLYEAMKQAGTFTGSLDDFKDQLRKARQEGKVELTRLDMPQAETTPSYGGDPARQKMIADSEMPQLKGQGGLHNTAVAHMVRVPAEAPKPDQPTLPLWNMAKGFVEDTGGAVNLSEMGAGIMKAARKVRDNWREMGGAMFPRTDRLDHDTSTKMTRIVAAPDYAKRTAPLYLQQVFGDKYTPEEGKLLMTTAQEMRLRRAKAVFQARGDTDKANAVGSFIAKQDSALQSEQQFLDTARSQPFRDFMGNWQKHFVPVMEDNYRKAQGIDDADLIPGATQIPGVPINMMAVDPNNPTPGTVKTGSRANLKNIQQRKFAFAREFTGSADAYETDPLAIIENSLAKGAKNAAQADLNRDLVEKGHAVWGQKGSQGITLADGRATKEIPFVNPPRGTQATDVQNASLFIDQAVAPEYMQALNLYETPGYQKFMGALAKSPTIASLASSVEGITHVKNMMTMMFNPEMGPIRLAQNAVRYMTGNPAITNKLILMAHEGMLKPAGPESGTLYDAAKSLAQRMGLSLPEKGKYADPTFWIGRGIDHLGSIMRLTASDAFDALAARPEGFGKVQGDLANKRDFVNQLGNYYKNGQSQLVSALKETGLQPFAVAAANYNVQGIRALTMDPGVRAASLKDAAVLRATKFTKMASLMATVPLINYLLHGRADGDDKTPWGAIKVGSGTDGKTRYIDPLEWTGARRGARLIGAQAVAENVQGGMKQTAGQVADKATTQAFQQILHQFAGPGPELGYTAITGKDFYGSQLASKAKPGESQHYQNLIAALANANPAYASLSGAKVPYGKGKEWEGWPELFGPYAPKTRAKTVGAPPLSRR